MKIRSSFVSNSSSSSFILGKSANTKEISIEELVDRINNDESPEDFFIISDAYEGVNAFELTAEMGYLIKNFSERFIKYGKSLIKHIFYKINAFYPDTRSWSSEQYGKNEGLEEGQSCIWVDNESIGSSHCYDSEAQFFKRFFLSYDEWYFVEDAYYSEDFSFCTKHMNKTCVYSNRKSLEESDSEYINSCDTIGFNEDFTYLDSTSMFAYKKLTKEEKQYIIDNKQKFKSNVYLYQDFEILGKNNTFSALESKVYYIMNLRGIIEKSKKLSIFEKTEEED